MPDRRFGWQIKGMSGELELTCALSSKHLGFVPCQGFRYLLQFFRIFSNFWSIFPTFQNFFTFIKTTQLRSLPGLPISTAWTQLDHRKAPFIIIMPTFNCSCQLFRNLIIQHKCVQGLCMQPCKLGWPSNAFLV